MLSIISTGPLRDPYVSLVGLGALGFGVWSLKLKFRVTDGCLGFRDDGVGFGLLAPLNVDDKRRA